MVDEKYLSASTIFVDDNAAAVGMEGKSYENFTFMKLLDKLERDRISRVEFTCEGRRGSFYTYEYRSAECELVKLTTTKQPSQDLSTIVYSISQHAKEGRNKKLI